MSFSVCLSFDVDGMSSWIGTAKSRNPSMLSRGEFTVVGTPRVLRFLKERDIRATFFVPGHTAYAFPDLVKAIRDDGHEIGHHGWVHENPADHDFDGEKEILEKGLEALDRVANIRPFGYRSPAWDLSIHSLELLESYGFNYDSSLMGGDFSPYYCRVGDQWSETEPYRFGETIGLVEMPINWSLDDFIAFESVMGLFPGLILPRHLEETWRDDFDFAIKEYPEGVFIPTMHPQCIGRGSRLKMLGRLVDHMKDSGAEFATMSESTSCWKRDNEISDWKDKNPLRTGINSISA